MTPEQLDEIEARANRATEGPWEEEWKIVPGTVGYEVSNFGNVRSYFKKGNHRTKRTAYPRTLAKRARKDGAYPTVNLPNKDGKYDTRAVHRLVMLAFVGECPEGKEVAHLNGDPSDNRLENLAYVTHVENESHKRLHGTHQVGESNSNAKLQGWQVAEIKYLASKSVPQGKIARLFDIDHKHVSEILNGNTWGNKSARTDVPQLVAEVRRLQGLVVSAQRAWDEGFTAGWEEATNPGAFVNDIWDAKTPNPYGVALGETDG